MHKNNAVNLNIIKIMTRQRSFLFLVVFTLMFFRGVSAQTVGIKSPVFPRNWGKSGAINRPMVQVGLPADPSFSAGTSNPYAGRKLEPVVFSLKAIPVISPGYYTERLGFFCRKELQLQKITVLPLRIRLGSADYVNWLEQKPNAVKPGL